MGCERPGLKPVAGELVVSPESVAFEPTSVGFPRAHEVVIGNRSRASRTLAVRTSGPFSTAVSEVIAGGGADTTVQLQFAPEAAGDFTGSLTISDEGETVSIALSGTGLLPSVCANAACETSTFDPELGRCVAAQAPDGTSCSNACLNDGRCANGRCVGTPIDCSDSNPCTLDACDPNSGCLHQPTQCEAPVNPCKAARCDPSMGCVESDVRDGTACGESDCVTAQVCITGMCKSVAAPDGASCGTASPCQGAGTCQQQVCVRPPASPLTEAWSYTFPGTTWSFRGVNDAAQNLYWLECALGGPTRPDTCEGCSYCSAVSFTSAGVQRFRTGLGLDDTFAPLHHLLAGDVLAWAMGTTVGALASSNGAPLWSLQLPLNLAGVSDVADAQRITGMAATPTGLTLTLSRTLGQMSRQSVLLQLNPLNGAIVFAKFFDGTVSAPVLDELGAITFHVEPWYSPNPLPAPSYLLSLSPTGVERWRVLAPAAMPWLLSRPVAVFQGELLLDDGEPRSMTDGARLAAAPMGTLTSFSPIGLTGHPLMGPNARVLLRMPQSGDQVNALSLRPGLDVPSWEVLVHELHGSNAISETVATDNGGFLVASGDSRHPTYLKAIDGAGVERFSCQLPFAAPQDMAAAMLDQRWVVLEPPYQLTPKLRAYDVGALRPAARGWVGKRGSPSGANRPLP